MDQNVGKYLIGIGILVVVAGLLIYFFHDKLGWIGRLPGDIRIEKEHTKVYIPITTMLLLSLILTLVINIVRKLF